MKKGLLATLIVIVVAWNLNLHSGDQIHWEYEGDDGPLFWGSLSPDYKLCRDGKNQSPIDLSIITPVLLGDIKFTYYASPKYIENNGHTIQVKMDRGSTITAVNGKTYKLIQFHFHVPSEHIIDGKPADMVVHLVHQANDGQLAVVAVLMMIGETNELIEQLWNHLPEKAGEMKFLPREINPIEFLPDDRGYYNYSGSLTTPPCSEGVNWMVLRSPVQVSAAQVDTFTRLFEKSVRPVQPAHGRLIKESE